MTDGDGKESSGVLVGMEKRVARIGVGGKRIARVADLSADLYLGERGLCTPTSILVRFTWARLG